MQSAYPLIGLLAWLQLKHFVVDYLLQPDWVLRQKGCQLHPGGYVHARPHVLGSLPALVLVGLSGSGIAGLFPGNLQFTSALIISAQLCCCSWR